MSIDQFVFPDVCVAVRGLRSGSLHFIIENFCTKKSIKMTQVLIEHEGTDSLFFLCRIEGKGFYPQSWLAHYPFSCFYNWKCYFLVVCHMLQRVLMTASPLFCLYLDLFNFPIIFTSILNMK